VNDRDVLRCLEGDIPLVINDLEAIRDLAGDIDDADIRRELSPYRLMIKHAISSLESMQEVVKWHLSVIRATRGGGGKDDE